MTLAGPDDRRDARGLHRGRIHLPVAQQTREALEPVQQLVLGSGICRTDGTGNALAGVVRHWTPLTVMEHQPRLKVV